MNRGEFRLLRQRLYNGAVPLTGKAAIKLARRPQERDCWSCSPQRRPQRAIFSMPTKTGLLLIGNLGPNWADIFKPKRFEMLSETNLDSYVV